MLSGYGSSIISDREIIEKILLRCIKKNRDNGNRVSRDWLENKLKTLVMVITEEELSEQEMRSIISSLFNSGKLWIGGDGIVQLRLPWIV